MVHFSVFSFPPDVVNRCFHDYAASCNLVHRFIAFFPFVDRLTKFLASSTNLHMWVHHLLSPLGLYECQPFDISSTVFVIGILMKPHSFSADPDPWPGQ